MKDIDITKILIVLFIGLSICFCAGVMYQYNVQLLDTEKDIRSQKALDVDAIIWADSMKMEAWIDGVKARAKKRKAK